MQCAAGSVLFCLKPNTKAIEYNGLRCRRAILLLCSKAVTKAGKDTPTTLPSTFSRISQPARAINPKKCIIVQCPFSLTPTWQIGFEQKIIMHQVLFYSRIFSQLVTVQLKFWHKINIILSNWIYYNSIVINLMFKLNFREFSNYHQYKDYNFKDYNFSLRISDL